MKDLPNDQQELVREVIDAITPRLPDHREIPGVELEQRNIWIERRGQDTGVDRISRYHEFECDYQIAEQTIPELVEAATKVGLFHGLYQGKKTQNATIKGDFLRDSRRDNGCTPIVKSWNFYREKSCDIEPQH